MLVPHELRVLPISFRGVDYVVQSSLVRVRARREVDEPP
jgi:hypothetical protein